MKLILTENQFKDNINHLIKTKGWIDTSEMVGLSDREMANMFFDNNPLEFLNIFDDLKTYNHENQKHVFYLNENDKIIMVYNIKKNEMNFIYDKIWHPLEIGFRIPYKDIQELTKNWLEDIYDLSINNARLVYEFELEKHLDRI